MLQTELECAVGKARSFSGRAKSHPANVASAGSNRSSHGGDKVTEAFDVKGLQWQLSKHAGPT